MQPLAINLAVTLFKSLGRCDTSTESRQLVSLALFQALAIQGKTRGFFEHETYKVVPSPSWLSWFITPMKSRYIYHKSELLEFSTNIANSGAPPGRDL